MLYSSGTDGRTDTKVKTEDTLSEFQDFFPSNFPSTYHQVAVLLSRKTGVHTLKKREGNFQPKNRDYGYFFQRQMKRMDFFQVKKGLFSR